MVRDLQRSAHWIKGLFGQSWQGQGGRPSLTGGRPKWPSLRGHALQPVFEEEQSVFGHLTFVQ